MKAMRIRFEKKVSPHGDVAHVAFITKNRIDVRGRPFKANEAVRAMLERGQKYYRIDFAGNVAGAWLPFEAIDSVHYPTLTAAKAAIQTYVDAPPSGDMRKRSSRRAKKRSSRRGTRKR